MEGAISEDFAFPSHFGGGTACVFLNPKAVAYGFLTHCLSLIQQEG